MADTEQLTSLFAPRGADTLGSDVLAEMQSILRLHSISPQELFYKWESYQIKMGSGDDVKLDLKTTRDFKKDLQDSLERGSKRPQEKKHVGATPRTAKGGDMFDMMEGIVATPLANTSGNASKRRQNFATPGSKATKQHATSSPNDTRTPGTSLPFASRQNAGEVIESLNTHIPVPDAPSVPYPESRVKLLANTDLSKFAYKPMAMKLSAASEILDDRIDSFVEIIQNHYNLEDGAFGNPATQSPSEIVAVGRIASDSAEGKLNAASVVLETSRRSGAGLRIPLTLDNLKSYDLFPGKIVALRGKNPSGESFVVEEVLETPLLHSAASSVPEFQTIDSRLRAGNEEGEVQPLNIIMSAGPYTADDNLDFEPLQALCEKAKDSVADVLVLVGPLLDTEHPLVASGNFPPLPPSIKTSPDSATITDVFRGLVALPLEALAKAVPSITIIIVPSVRDSISKHAAWPQDRMSRKVFGLPKQCSITTNPFIAQLNEIALAVSSQDVLFELKRETCSKQAADGKPVLDRLSKALIEQRHFFPLFPPSARDNLPKPADVEGLDEGGPKAAGASLDVSYLALGEWHKRRPDILITPSSLGPFVKVVENVVVINPGTLSKKRGPGTYAQLFVKAREISEQEASQEVLAHNVYERTRVEVTKI